MEQKNSQTFKIDKKYHKDILNFIKLNEIGDVDVFINKCFKKGFDVERFGLLGNETEVREVEKIVEKIVEVPVEKVVEIVKEVPSPPVEIEVIKYIEKEVPVEKIVSKIEYIYDKKEDEVVPNLDNIRDEKKTKMLESTLLNLRKDLQLKQIKINELEDTIKHLQEQLNKNVNAIYLKGSNLKEKI